MDSVLTYKGEVTKAMQMIGEHPRTIFVGQTVVYPGSVLSDTFKLVPDNKKIEMPVMEEAQMGMCIGLSLAGYIPICVYPRIDFLLCAMNQLSNHLDVMGELTHNEFNAKVIIRTIIGATEPMYPGIQHCRDHTKVFEVLLKNVNVVKLENATEIMPVYNGAIRSYKSTLIIEEAKLY